MHSLACGDNMYGQAMLMIVVGSPWPRESFFICDLSGLMGRL